MKLVRESINEDVYYEPEPRKRDIVKELEEIVSKNIDLESEWLYIKHGGRDIEVGTLPYTNREGKKITPKFDGDEARELAESIIKDLENNGFDGYEIYSIGSTMICISVD